MPSYDDDDNRPRRNRRRDDDEDARPRKKKRKKGGLGAGAIVAIVMGGVLLLGGAGFGIHALTRGSNPGGSNAGGSNMGGSNVGGSKAPVPKGWVEFTSREDGFRAYLPARPGRDDYPDGGKSWWRSTSSVFRAMDEDGESVVLNVYRFRRRLTTDERDNVLKEYVGVPSAMKSVTWAGHTAKETVEVEGNREYLMRFFTTETRLFHVMVSSRQGKVKRETQDGFFDNFQLLD
jgi:hypothetical protein